MTPRPALRSGPGGTGTHSLYLTGAIASAPMVALAVARTGVFFVTGLPESVEDWFALFGRSRLLGPLAFNALTARRLLILARRRTSAHLDTRDLPSLSAYRCP